MTKALTIVSNPASPTAEGPVHIDGPAASSDDMQADPVRHGVKSLAKATEILDCFSTMDRELSVSEIARRTRLPKSTAHRIIDSLRAVGFLEQDSSRDHYRLGLRLFQLGSTALANMDVHREARPFVDTLSKIGGENVHLCLFDGTHMVVVDRMNSKSSNTQNTLTTLEASPCYCTGVGKAALAFQQDAIIDKVIRLGLNRHTPSTITDPDAFRTELAAIRERGYAIDNSEYDTAVRCVAAPIRNVAGHVFASISLSGAARRMTDQRLQEMAPVVVSHAQAISARLGYRGS